MPLAFPSESGLEQPEDLSFLQQQHAVRISTALAKAYICKGASKKTWVLLVLGNVCKFFNCRCSQTAGSMKSQTSYLIKSLDVDSEQDIIIIFIYLFSSKAVVCNKYLGFEYTFALLYACRYIHFIMQFFVAQQSFLKYLFTTPFTLLLHFS